MPDPDTTTDVTRHAPPRPGTRPGPSGVPARVGRYEVREVLGEGAFGRVYRGFDPDLQREVAIKVPHREVLSVGIRERFVREARAAATIHHPNVCPIYDVGVDEGLPYLVMRLVPGRTLAEVLALRAGPYPPREAADVVRLLALGVAEAHARGVIHRDLKPGNVLVDETRREVLITDFGMARVGGEARLTPDGDVLGTPSYMAPEQARGEMAAVGPASDVYSLGVILYRLLTGEVPFQGTVLEVLAQVRDATPPQPAVVREDLDLGLSELCMRAMAKRPADRFPSAEGLAATLAAYLMAADLVDRRDRPPAVLFNFSLGDGSAPCTPTTDTSASEVTAAPEPAEQSVVLPGGPPAAAPNMAAFNDMPDPSPLGPAVGTRRRYRLGRVARIVGLLVVGAFLLLAGGAIVAAVPPSVQRDLIGLGSGLALGLVVQQGWARYQRG